MTFCWGVCRVGEVGAFGTGERGCSGGGWWPMERVCSTGVGEDIPARSQVYQPKLDLLSQHIGHDWIG